MKLRFLIVMIASLAIIASCNDKPDPVKPDPIDPCEGRRNLVPSITIYEGNYMAEKQFLVKDTVLYGNDITFEAPVGFAGYSWRIGSDEREINERTVTFWFPDAVGRVPIMLIVRNPIKCGDYSQEYDTLYSYIYVKNRIDASIVGEYFGAHDDDPLDTFTVSILFGVNLIYKDELFVVNINKGCGDDSPISFYKRRLLTDKSVLLEMTSGDLTGKCLFPRGIGYLAENDNDSLIFDYAWGEMEKGDTIRQTFRGRRLK